MRRKNPPKNVKKVGTGLTQFEQATLSSSSTPEEADAFREFKANTSHLPSTLREGMKLFVEAAQNEFTRRKIPWPAGHSTISEDGEKFIYHHKQQDLVLNLDNPDQMKNYFERNFDVDSREWYLNEIIKNFTLSKRVEEIELKIEFSMKAAMMYERYTWKIYHENDALKGKENRANLSTASQMASETAKTSTRRKKRVIADVVIKLRQEHPLIGTNKSALAKKISEMDLPELRTSKGGNMQADTIRRYIV